MKNSPLVSIAIRYGLIAAVLAFSLLAGLFYFGHHPLMVAPFLDFRIVLFGLFIFFCLKEYRDTHQDGVLYFWQGMVASFIIVMLVGTVASLLLLMFCELEKEFIPSYVQAMTEYLQTFPEEDVARIGKETFERNLKDLSSTNGKQLASLYFAQSIMIGLFVSIIMSVILRKLPKP
jgi:hypothetical protein